MADNNPITTAFELQRSAVEQTHQVTVETLEAQKTAVNAAAESVDTYEQVAQQSTSIGHDAVHAYLDALEQVNADVDLEELRELVDDGFESAEEFQSEAWDAVEEAVDESVDGFETAADNYSEFVDSTFDTYLEAHEQVEDSVDEFEEIDVSAD